MPEHRKQSGSQRWNGQSEREDRRSEPADHRAPPGAIRRSPVLRRKSGCVNVLDAPLRLVIASETSANLPNQTTTCIGDERLGS